MAATEREQNCWKRGSQGTMKSSYWKIIYLDAEISVTSENGSEPEGKNLQKKTGRRTQEVHKCLYCGIIEYANLLM